jgi:hypothetical protein
MGKARQSRLWDTIREKMKWKGTKAEFEAQFGPIKNFEYRGTGTILPEPQKPKKEKKGVRATTG